MTKLNIKEAVRRTSLLKKCHGDVDFSRNMNKNLVALSFLASESVLVWNNYGGSSPSK